MKTILVPTDFSQLSRSAVMYAAKLAKKLSAKIILLTVHNISNAETLLKRQRLVDEMVKYSQEDSKELITEIKSIVKGRLDISWQNIAGVPFHEIIERFATQHQVDLIIMGTKGATGLKKVLMGSNTAAVINHSSVPVLAIPEQSAFKVKKIIYATDLTNLHNEINTVVPFASLFRASIHVLHVTDLASAKNIEKKKTAQELIQQTGYPRIFFHVSCQAGSSEIAEEVDAFVNRQHADMLAMFTHRVDFYEKLFGKSITRQFAFHNQLPLLTFNKTTSLQHINVRKEKYEVAT